MTISRRTAIHRAITTLGGLAVSARVAHASTTQRAEHNAKRMLFLGGTGFLGPHMVEAALKRGYQVTLLTRGRAGKELFPDAERLIGDRAGDMPALKGKTWDVVVDNSGYVPANVRTSATLLRDSVGHYVYTSTIDAYRDFHTAGITEEYPLAQLPVGEPHNPNKYYGPLKALCEQEVRTVFPSKHTIIRPGWVAGPGDNNNLFAYWVKRVQRGGEFLAPGTPTDPFQLVDVRDLAAFVIEAADKSITGPFNVVAPPMGFGEMLSVVQQTLGKIATPVWVNGDFLKAKGVRPYFDMPMWWPPRNDYDALNIPSGLGGGVGAFRISGEKARMAGARYRPLADTTRDLLAWYDKEIDEWPETGRPGLTTVRERTLLAEWRRERGG